MTFSINNVNEYGSLTNFGVVKFAARNTFLIDPAGKIAKTYTGVNPNSHSAEVVSHQVSPEVRTRDLVTTGEAASEILRIARQEHADLIVIATHGLTGWRRLVFGSVAEKVVRQATCPVLTIVAPAAAEK